MNPDAGWCPNPNHHGCYLMSGGRLRHVQRADALWDPGSPDLRSLKNLCRPEDNPHRDGGGTDAR